MPTLWGMVQELWPYLDELNANEQRFVNECYQYLDPHDPETELSERQIRWLMAIFDKYCNGIATAWNDSEEDV